MRPLATHTRFCWALCRSRLCCPQPGHRSRGAALRGCSAPGRQLAGAEGHQAHIYARSVQQCQGVAMIQAVPCPAAPCSFSRSASRRPCIPCPAFAMPVHRLCIRAWCGQDGAGWTKRARERVNVAVAGACAEAARQLEALWATKAELQLGAGGGAAGGSAKAVDGHEAGVNTHRQSHAAKIMYQSHRRSNPTSGGCA